MRDNLIEICNLLTKDETLLRLLYYKPSDSMDNPLDPAKENILDKPDLEKQQIINDCIKTTSKMDDLSLEAKSRLFLSPGKRENTNNYLVSLQKINFDIVVHFDFEDIDFRLSWISDRINELLSGKRITGMGKVTFAAGEIISEVPENYIGYRLIYMFGSGS